MTEENKPRWYWPEISDMRTAVAASNQGFWAAVIVAIFTFLLATVVLFTKSSIAVSDSASAYFDALIFGIIAVGIRYRNRGFAIAGLFLFILEKIFLISAGVFWGAGLLIASFITLSFIHGIRGTFAIHRYRKMPQEMLT